MMRYVARARLARVVTAGTSLGATSLLSPTSNVLPDGSANQNRWAKIVQSSSVTVIPRVAAVSKWAGNIPLKPCNSREDCDREGRRFFRALLLSLKRLRKVGWRLLEFQPTQENVDEYAENTVWAANFHFRRFSHRLAIFGGGAHSTVCNVVRNRNSRQASSALLVHDVLSNPNVLHDDARHIRRIDVADINQLNNLAQ